MCGVLFTTLENGILILLDGWWRKKFLIAPSATATLEDESLIRAMWPFQSALAPVAPVNSSKCSRRLGTVAFLPVMWLVWSGPLVIKLLCASVKEKDGPSMIFPSARAPGISLGPAFSLSVLSVCLASSILTEMNGSIKGNGNNRWSGRPTVKYEK